MKVPYLYQIRKIEKVIDGDTVDVIIDLGFDISLAKRIRLAGIDSPESRTRDLTEKKFGLEAKEWLKKQLAQAEKILIKTELTDSSEKYGRTLGIFFLDSNNTPVNDQMIQQGYAWEYDGGTKKKDYDLLLFRRS